jgi:hypothetical protein
MRALVIVLFLAAGCATSRKPTPPPCVADVSTWDGCVAASDDAAAKP